MEFERYGNNIPRQIHFRIYDLITKYFIYYKETPLENYRKFVCHVTDSVIVHISQSCVREDNKNVTLDM